MTDNKDMGYLPEDHVCRCCLYRVVSRKLPNGETEYACLNCGASVIADNVKAICMCGLKIGKYYPYVCVKNELKTPVSTAEFVAMVKG